MLIESGYDRVRAVSYALKWALSRNPRYYDFENIGGDCTNFVSQCLYAGCRVMNYSGDDGWYYISPDDRAPAWTGVEFLNRFLLTNKGPAVYAETVEGFITRCLYPIFSIRALRKVFSPVRTPMTQEIAGFPAMITPKPWGSA